MLPDEMVFNRMSGVWNLSTEQGNLGVMQITNVRIVWHAELAFNFNVSLPWIQIKTAKVRDSKVGLAIAIETTNFAGNYVLGFRMENVNDVFLEMQKLFKIQSEKPVLGVEVQIDVEQEREKVVRMRPDDIEITESDQQFHNASGMKAQLMGSDEKEGGGQARPIVFNTDLGLAIEEPADGLDIQSLWKIV